jgi:hypothetical protein
MSVSYSYLPGNQDVYDCFFVYALNGVKLLSLTLLSHTSNVSVRPFSTYTTYSHLSPNLTTHFLRDFIFLRDFLPSVFMPATKNLSKGISPIKFWMHSWIPSF